MNDTALIILLIPTAEISGKIYKKTYRMVEILIVNVPIFHFNKGSDVMDFLDLMNVEKVYLMNVEEPMENSLRLTFVRSKTNSVPETLKIADKVIDNLYSINRDYSIPLLQIDFETYIGYSVLNESFTSLDDYEEFVGKAFRIFKKSRYLDYIMVGTFASEEYPGPFKHYEIACLNHIVNIVSMSEPIIKEIQEIK